MCENAVIHTDIEPAVITTDMIQNAFREQGPTGEIGRLMEEECYDIHTTPCKELRLEFLNILRIDHLWMLTGLTKLQLSNNTIEKIENLNELVNLVELDLSFNRIGKIENVECLVNLEVFTLYENKIQNLENIDNLENLEMFSIGQNQISDVECVRYLRKFKKLKALNMAGNPCSSEDFRKRVAAFIPQLIYYQYKMISPIEKEDGRKEYISDIESIEEEELKQLKILEAKAIFDEKFKEDKAAFVENLDKTQLFDALFANDPEGQAARMTAQEAEEIFDGFKENMTKITKSLFELGGKQLVLRRDEIRQFQLTVTRTKTASIATSRSAIEEFLVKKSDLLYRTELLVGQFTESGMNEKKYQETIQMIKTCGDELQQACQELWQLLMRNELILFEQLEELNVTFERSMTDLINVFLEQAQGYFAQLREQETTFMELITENLLRFQTKVAIRNEDLSEYPLALKNMMADKDTIHAGMAASHDVHGSVIDAREDLMTSRIRDWLEDMITTFQNNEQKRNRGIVTEISHFLDYQREEFDFLQSQVTQPFYDLDDDLIDPPPATGKQRGSKDSVMSHGTVLSFASVEVQPVQTS